MPRAVDWDRSGLSRALSAGYKPTVLRRTDLGQLLELIRAKQERDFGRQVSCGGAQSSSPEAA